MQGQMYRTENRLPNSMCNQITAWVLTTRFIFCYAGNPDQEEPVAVIPTKDFHQWLRTDTDELIWSVGNVYDIKGYTLASTDDFWNYPDYNQWRILQRLNEFNSLTLTIA